MTIQFRQSPNYDKGRRGTPIDTIIYHWINGPLSIADAAFARPSRMASAHFAVEDETVHQYVKIEDTAWHAGVYKVNMRSVGIEHSAQPGRDASEATYETSARLVLDIAQHIGRRVGDFQHLPHRAVKNTACPGTIDIDRIVRRAMELEQIALGGIDQPTSEAIPAQKSSVEFSSWGVTSGTFFVKVTAPQGLKVRTGPSVTSSEISAKRLKLGDIVECVLAVTGDDPYGDGRNIWLRTKVSGLYLWAGATNYK